MTSVSTTTSVPFWIRKSYKMALVGRARFPSEVVRLILKFTATECEGLYVLLWGRDCFPCDYDSCIVCGWKNAHLITSYQASWNYNRERWNFRYCCSPRCLEVAEELDHEEKFYFQWERDVLPTIKYLWPE